MVELPDDQAKPREVKAWPASDHKDETGRGNARRRFLERAVLASPAVFTLFHGAARANASWYQCIDKDRQHFLDQGGAKRGGGNQTGELLHDNASGPWARQSVEAIRVQRRSLNNNDRYPKRWVVDYGGGNWYDHRWRLFTLEGYDSSGNPILLRGNSNTHNDNLWDQIDEADRLELVCVDDNGDILSRVDPSQTDDAAICPTGNPVTNSCWSSFR